MCIDLIFYYEDSQWTAAKWFKLWRKEDEEFESRLKNDPALGKFSNKYFYIWNGNHRHLAWMEIINLLHKNDASFYVRVRSVVINVTQENCNMLLHAMTNWNKYDSFFSAMHCVFQLYIRWLNHRMNDNLMIL